MNLTLAELLVEKSAKDRIHHEEWNALVRYFKQDRQGSAGFIDGLADARTDTPVFRRPWFPAWTTIDIPPWSLFTITDGQPPPQFLEPVLQVAKFSSSNLSAGVLLTNGIFEGFADSFASVRFIDTWDPVLLKIAGDASEINDEAGPASGEWTVDDGGAGLIAVTDANEDEYQWFVRSVGGPGLCEATLDNDLHYNGSTTVTVYKGKGPGPEDPVTTGMLPDGYKLLAGDVVVIALIDGEYRAIAAKGCPELI